MKRLKLTWWITLAVMACVVLTGGVASAQNGQGLSAVGAISTANTFPRWYMDKSGLQLSQCLNITAPTDPCVLGIVPGSPAPNVLPNPAAPLAFTANFPNEFFYWRSTLDISGIGGNNANRARLVLSTQGGFGGPTLTAADGPAAVGVFARWRIRVVPGGLVPGATYTFTGPYGSTSLVADATGSINFTSDQGCVPTPGAAPPPCNFAAVLANTNVGPWLVWDPAVAPLPAAGFTGDGLIAPSVINSPVAQNFFRVSGPNVGGPGVNVIESNQFTNVIGELYVRPATTTTLTSTPNPSVFGQAVTLTSTVRGPVGDPLVPTGTVTIKDGATTLGAVALVNGSATLVTSALTTGNHSLTAVYSGSANFLASTSPAVNQVVNSQTTTTLTAAPNPSVIGQAVTLTVVVSPVAPGTGVPTGTVTFKDGATVLATVTLAAGRASFTTSTLAVGSHSLTAAYSGGGNFLASTSTVVTQTVNPGSTSTVLTSTPNPSTTGQTVTLNATVTAVAPAVGVPTGTMTFRDGATVLGTATLVNGSASISISTLAVGSHPLTAAYGGSATFAASTSAVVTQIVNAPAAAATTTTLTSTPNPSTTGQAVTLNATVTSAAGAPDGTAALREGATVLGTPLLVNNSASIVTSTLAAGSHPLTAAYNGSATFAASPSAVVTQVVNAPAVRDTVTITRNELRVGTGELRIEGTNTQIPGGGSAASVTIHDGAAVGASCPGAVIGTASAAGGTWQFRQVTPFRPTTICVQSAGGGVASGAVTQR